MAKPPKNLLPALSQLQTGQFTEIRLILGDQLNAEHNWYRKKDPSILYVLAELHEEASYVKHHIQKVAAFFLGMAQFAQALSKAKHTVLHLTLDDTKGINNAADLLKILAEHFSLDKIAYQEPDEYRVQEYLKDLASRFEVTIASTEHFYLSAQELPKYVAPDKHNRLENFYRKLRKRFDILMVDDKPLGEQWNYDAENRAKLKPADIKEIPEPLLFANDVSDILARIKAHKLKTLGQCGDTLLWPVTRKQACELLDYFCDVCLPNFGRFQDAMTANSQHRWSLYHSRLSFALNAKILSPKMVIDKAVEAYENSGDAISLAQIEGFVRQILGWREYVRAVYWQNMPAYLEKNALNAQRTLPDFYWTGKTQMKCMSQAIGQSLEYAYAHHIQRLMITGNFGLLAGIDPAAMDEWYLGIYIDALQWVELPNTRGMSQFADGGWVATKPYCSGGNYINKMSDYCKSCHYDIKEKTTENACPFNSLYWAFLDTHREKFSKNQRMSMIYRTWDKQGEEQQQATLKRAHNILDNLDSL